MVGLLIKSIGPSKAHTGSAKTIVIPLYIWKLLKTLAGFKALARSVLFNLMIEDFNDLD